jgi:DNA-binding MarR family transcriptional regulator
VSHRSNAKGGSHPRSTAFLIAQIGAHAAARFAERLSGLALLPAHAGILRVIGSSAGVSQQELSARLGMLPSRLVPLIDALEERGLLERRDNAADRRLYALHLTDRGAKTLTEVGRVARLHDDELCAALDTKERELLGGLLRRIADEQGLTPGVHPGFARVRREGAE